MAKAGIQPITTASLATPKLPKVQGMKSKPTKVAKPDTKMMRALFGSKPMKASVQSVPTKTPSY